MDGGILQQALPSSRAQAKVHGLTRYYTGKPCKYGHDSVRSINGAKCLKCEQRKDKNRVDAKRQVAKKYRDQNGDKIKARKRALYRLDPQMATAVRKNWRANNLAKARASDRAHYEKNRAARTALVAARDAAKIKATPKWADLEAIRAIYHEVERITAETGVKHHVDHVIPLRNPLVCGLHVPWNLRALEARANMVKGNRLIQHD